jgi:hypothetical protein
VKRRDFIGICAAGAAAGINPALAANGDDNPAASTGFLSTTCKE